MSIPTYFLFESLATTQVVPLPTKGSNTIPSGGQVESIGISINSGGYTAKCAPFTFPPDADISQTVNFGLDGHLPLSINC